MLDKIRAVQIGCGPIGCSVAKMAFERPDIELVGAIDKDKNKIGRDLGQIIGIGRKLGVIVSDDVDEIFAMAKADVAFHQTSSSLKIIYPQLDWILGCGVNIISTCEELSYPFRKQPKLAAKIDKRAKANKVTVLATGVNPGFVMDSWPLAMTAVCKQISKVKVVRVQDARTRRLSFQKKIGAGLTPEEFRKLVNSETLKHVGLPESMAMIAAGLRWELDEIIENIEPIIATTQVQSDYIKVEPGQVAGVSQKCCGFRIREEVITLEFKASIGSLESYDAVYLNAIPNMEIVIKGGTPGDIATPAIVVNAAHRVVEAPPGLVTMKDLPLVFCTTG